MSHPRPPGHGRDASQDHRFELVMTVIVVAVLVVAALVVVAQLPGGGNDEAGNSATSGATTSGRSPTTRITVDTPDPPTISSPPPQTTRTTAPGSGSEPKGLDINVIGPGFSSADGTFRFRYDRLPTFDGPDTWGCNIVDDSSIEEYHITCMNDGGTFPTNPSGSIGLVLSYPCKQGCDVTEARRVLGEITKFPDPVRGRDYVTASESQPDNTDDPNAVRLMVAVPWPERNTVIAASFIALPDEIDDVRKMLRSIYESARG